MYISTDKDTCHEIKKVIDSQVDQPKSIRIGIAGFACSGPQFGLGLDDATDEDYTEEIHDVKFVLKKDIFDSMGEIMVSFNGSGYVVKPVDQPESACGSCGGSCG